MKKIISGLLLVLAGFPPAFAQLPMPTLGARTAPPTAVAVAAAPAQPASGLLNGYVADDTYVLRVGDTVSFQILEDRLLGIQELPVNLVVTDSGELDVTYIGRVKAVGKTSKQLAADIKAALEKVEGIGQVLVNMTFDPPWTPDRMSEEAKLELNMF